MAERLRDLKLQSQDSRLVLFGSTVFKVKLRASRDLREMTQVQSRAVVIQRDLKRVMAAILSQVLTHNTLPLVRTDSVAVYTGSYPWTACEKLYFSHKNQPLSAHPNIILMLAFLPQPLAPTQHKSALSSKLGKHRRCVVQSDTGSLQLFQPTTEGSADECMVYKKMRSAPEEASASAQVPDPSSASLPTGGSGGERGVATERQLVVASAEQSRKRLYELSQPCWGGEEEGTELVEEATVGQDSDLEAGRSLFQYVKKVCLGWMW